LTAGALLEDVEPEIYLLGILDDLAVSAAFFSFERV
jgi:hypothetical protein